MSTFLVSLGVLAATIAVVLRVALGGQDQPATVRREPFRARPPRPRARARTAPTAAMSIPGTPALALPDSDAMRLQVLPAAPTTVWVRVRSGVALVVLVGVLGALLALSVGGLLVGGAFLVRSATG